MDVERVNQAVADSYEAIDVYLQYCQLASLLPSSEREPEYLRCQRCDTNLGVLMNEHGLAIGHFQRREGKWSQLIGGALLRGSRIELKCPRCGYVKRWRKPP